MRSLHASGVHGAMWGSLMIAIVLGAWIVWALRAQIPLYEVSDSARLEVQYAARPIEAQVAGRVSLNHLVLGEQVQAGQVLVELDADTERLQLAEEETQSPALKSQLSALQSEVETTEQALVEARQTARTSLDEAQARFREAEEGARFARVEAGQLESLHAGGVISDLEFMRAKSEAQRRAATSDSMRIALKRVEQEHRTTESDRQSHLDRLRGEMRRIEGQMSTDQATIRRMQHEIEKRRIQAPVTGRVGQVVELRPGAYVEKGTKLGVIIPDGGVRVIAYFPPRAALGRIQPGQGARVRLEGFPWSQYGSLAATVVTVAGEAEDGRVRVELDARPDPASALPMQHGLPGTVEIAVKKVTPFMLILQYVGRTLSTPQAATR
jgi:multidrug resistance efflux pump